MELIDRINFLKNVAIFDNTPENLVEMIANNLTEISVGKGDHIVLKGEIGDSMYFITSGKVTVHDGDHVFTELNAGDFFGKYYLIDRKERSATVTAIEPCTLLALNHDLFKSLTDGENTIVTGILKTLVGRLRDMNVAEEQLAARNREVEIQKAELEQQRRELLELNATKDRFFSIIAHDLRSPITTLVSLSDVLLTEMESLSPEQTTDVLTSLYDLSKNYLKLLDNLLQWSRMQTGGLIANPEKFDLKELIHEVVSIYQTTAIEKQITLINGVNEHAMIHADVNMIRTVLRNLLSNALKYTNKQGTVKISMEKVAGSAEVSVVDTGVGMTKDMINRLFLLDQTFSTKGTANERGTGLGLLLCKEFLEKNSGILSVKSEPGSGSTFSFLLPISS